MIKIDPMNINHLSWSYCRSQIFVDITYIFFLCGFFAQKADKKEINFRWQIVHFEGSTNHFIHLHPKSQVLPKLPSKNIEKRKKWQNPFTQFLKTNGKNKKNGENWAPEGEKGKESRKEKKALDPILSNFFKQKSFSIEHDIFEIKFKTQFDSRVTSKLFLPTRGY